jgi:osmotically-inducible protein OsmY
MKKPVLILVLFVSMALFLGSASRTFADRSAGEVIDDATITTVVKYELATDVKFSTLKNVQVDTQKGEVTITGKVHSEEEKQHAGSLAHIKGVVKVNDMLSVVPKN